MSTQIDDYLEKLKMVAHIRAKHPDANLTWPYFIDGTPKPPTPAQARREATLRKKHLDCERPVCRRHRRCAFVVDKRLAYEAPTSNGYCKLFGPEPDAVARWADLQLGRLIDLM